MKRGLFNSFDCYNKLKVNISWARVGLFELSKKDIINPVDEYCSKYCCFVKGQKFVEESKGTKELTNKKQGKKGEKREK